MQQSDNKIKTKLSACWEKRSYRIRPIFSADNISNTNNNANNCFRWKKK